MTKPTEAWRRRLSDRVTTLPAIARYLIAIAAAVAGVMIRLGLDPVWGDKFPFITLFPAVMFSAWVGGFGPGIVTTVVSAAAATHYWIAPQHAWTVSASRDLLPLAFFTVGGVGLCALNETWRRGSSALIESEQRLGVTIESIGDGVLATDADGCVTRMNAVAESLTGWKTADALGRSVDDVFVIVGEGSLQPRANPIRRVLRDGVAATLENHTLLVSRDGRRIPIDDSAAPIRGADGEITGAIMVFRDVSDRRRMDEERLRQDRAARELAAIIESSDDAIVSKDLQSTIRSWNRGAERIFGYSADEMIGRSIRIIIPEDRWSEEDDVLRLLRQGLKVDHFETVRRRKDGTDVHVSHTVSPIYSPAGAVIGASAIARDISERRQIELERAEMLRREQAARADVERASHLKDDFLAVLSHELRTPLNAVLGYAQLLSAGALPPDEMAHAFQAIERNALAQARLVESLLDLSRILAGKLELRLEDLSLASVIEGAADVLRPDALKKHITLELSVTEEPIAITGDGHRLQQVFWNLFSNAIKFTAPGGRVSAVVTVSDLHARVQVIDNGQGIAADLLPFVFDRFKQGEGAGVEASSGLGLGLALVREIVQAHGGSVSAASEGERRGATFTVTLPLAPARTMPPAGLAHLISQQHMPLIGAPLDILVVDDEGDARTVLALMLSARGATVRTAASVAEALDALRDRPPDVLLADLGMPYEDGFSLVQRWRAEEAGRRVARVPAIAVTAYASQRDRDRALTAGFDWHVAKPVDADELVRVIAALTAPHRA